jgi:ribosomal protein S18 acetylase RimI-like enzyme
MTLRLATARDRDFLTAMLIEAASWDPLRAPLTKEQLLAEPKLRHYVDGWPRAGDTGLIALDPAGNAVGAAWLRCFPADNPGYGFVDPQTPELSIGVDADHRGRGVGRKLCAGILDRAARSGLRRVSLSVAKANRAAALYPRLGFRVHADAGDALILLWSAP